MSNIAVMTTGGDAPGMNAAIRAATRTAISSGFSVYGIEDGYRGLLDGKFRAMTSRSVSGIINKGGTILQTLRCPEFKKKNNREKAYKNMSARRIGGILVIGGDGSRRGAHLITRETGIPSVFIPASIDNDVSGTERTIGFDTAVNTGLTAVDRIRDTAESHERIFIVEVMGREHGFLALEIGVTGGAEVVLLPEFKKDVNALKVSRFLKQGIKKGKNSSIIVMAEGAGNCAGFAEKLSGKMRLEVRYSVLGYIQRGGSPTAESRKLGLLFGYRAVKEIRRMKKGQSCMVGIKGGSIAVTDMAKVIGKERKINRQLYEMSGKFAV